jgi:hypothetical protein
VNEYDVLEKFFHRSEKLATEHFRGERYYVQFTDETGTTYEAAWSGLNVRIFRMGHEMAFGRIDIETGKLVEVQTSVPDAAIDELSELIRCTEQKNETLKDPTDDKEDEKTMVDETPEYLDQDETWEAARLTQELTDLVHRHGALSVASCANRAIALASVPHQEPPPAEPKPRTLTMVAWGHIEGFTLTVPLAIARGEWDLSRGPVAFFLSFTPAWYDREARVVSVSPVDSLQGELSVLRYSILTSSGPVPVELQNLKLHQGEKLQVECLWKP